MSVFLIAAAAVPATVAGAVSTVIGSDVLSMFAELLLGNTGGQGADLGSILSNGTILNGLYNAVKDKLATMNVDTTNMTIEDVRSALLTTLQGMDTLQAASELAKIFTGSNNSSTFNEIVNILAAAYPPMTTEPTEPTEIVTLPEPTSNYAPVISEEPGTVGSDTIPTAAPYTGVDYSGYTLTTSVYVPSEEPTLTESPTYNLVPPATEYADLVTAAPYEANVMDEQDDSLPGASSATKVVLGVALITISLGAVVGVAIMLRKTKA